MRRKFKEIDPKEFEDSVEFNKVTMKGEMRKLYPAINRKLKQGWTANDVVTWFNKRDIPMTVSLFRIYLWDLDRENGYKRSTGEHINTPQKHVNKLSDSTPSKPLLPNDINKSSSTSSQQTSENRKISNPRDVKKARDQEVDFDNYDKE